MARKRSSKGGRKRTPSLKGTGLTIDPRTGIYLWKKKRPHTSKKITRSTGTRLIDVALARRQEFEEEFQRELAGLSKYRGYARPIRSFLHSFLDAIHGAQGRKEALQFQLERAFRLLRLETLADMEDFISIEKKLLRLEVGDGDTPDNESTFRRTTLVRGFQAPLKQFSRWLASRREVLADHLGPWCLLKTDRNAQPGKSRRALAPEEMVRALAAVDCLDGIFRRANPLRQFYEAMLIAAPRVSALAALDVTDIDHDMRQLAFEGRGNKRAGAGMLDSTTYADVVAYAGRREDGPLFLSANGERIDPVNSLKDWQEAVLLAAVDLEWPEDESRDLMMEFYVGKAIKTKGIRVDRGGPRTGRNAPGPAKLMERRRRAEIARRISTRIRSAVVERTHGVDQHCLRMTHRTWALMSSVPEILIDRQLGHTSPGGEAALKAAWSLVGRSHYTDMNMLAGDARRSAEAVRKVLDRAEAELQEATARGDTALISPRNMLARTGVSR